VRDWDISTKILNTQQPLCLIFTPYPLIMSDVSLSCFVRPIFSAEITCFFSRSPKKTFVDFWCEICFAQAGRMPFLSPNQQCKVVITTTTRFRFDFDSSAGRPRYYHSTTRRQDGPLQRGLNIINSFSVTAASSLRHCDLNDLRLAVEWPSNSRRVVVLTTCLKASFIFWCIVSK